jgi:peptide/nickel transport system permease protein
LSTVWEASEEVWARASAIRWHRRLLRSGGSIAAISFLALVVVLSFTVQWISPYSPTEIDYRSILHGPSWSHPFGTDELGRDLFTRVLYGGRIAVFISVMGVVIASILGVTLGTIAGYFGGVVDELISRIFDVLMAFPAILLAIAVVAALGSSLWTMLVALAIVFLPEFGRIIRSATLSVREREYIVAAEGLGYRPWRILLRHVLPNISTPVLIVATGVGARLILAESILSFLGVGVKPPTPSWGAMIGEGQSFIQSHAYMALIPGAVLVLTSLALNFLGDALRDVFDVELR